MSLGQKIKEEIKRIGSVALYFALCFGFANVSPSLNMR